MHKFAAPRIAQGHDVRRLRLYDGGELFTTIYSDFTEHSLLVENHVDDPRKTAFGEEVQPTWDRFLDFLGKRCQPCLAEDIQAHLAILGMDDAHPLVVVQKDPERVNADQEWIMLEILK